MKLKAILSVIMLYSGVSISYAQDFWLTYSSPTINLVIRDNYMSVVELINEYDVVLGSGLNGLSKHEVKKHLTIPDKKLEALKLAITKSGFFATPQKVYTFDSDEKTQLFTLFIALKGSGNHVYRHVAYFNSRPPESFLLVQEALLNLAMDAYAYDLE
ncbi:MAG: hypothetical protein K2Q22_10060 [Cytophagales bacterium]|nr:hypothetical protein [Cytophagales bacterium]